MRRLALVLLVAVLAGCGGGSSKPALTVSAAASLKQAFTRYGTQFRDAQARFSFAGSDALAAQIEQGVKPDVYAAANPNQVVISRYLVVDYGPGTYLFDRISLGVGKMYTSGNFEAQACTTEASC